MTDKKYQDSILMLIFYVTTFKLRVMGYSKNDINEHGSEMAEAIIGQSCE